MQVVADTSALVSLGVVLDRVPNPLEVVLDTCYEHGVRAMVHRDHTDAVLTSGAASDLVEIDLELWD